VLPNTRLSLNPTLRVLSYNKYAINIDKERNCYNYRKFGYIAKHCRERENQGRVGQGRRVNYKDNQNNASNLNEEKN